MKPEDPHHDDIGELLRARKPDVPVPPGMEARILRALDSQQQLKRESRVHWWRWLLIPPALAMGLVLLFATKDSKSPPSSSIVRKGNPVVVPTPLPEQDGPSVVSIYEGNPLLAESKALSRDAERTGRFLLDCLPSVSSVAGR